MHLQDVGFDGLEPVEGKAEELAQRLRGTVLPHLLRFRATAKAFNNVVLCDDHEAVPRPPNKGKRSKGSRELSGLIDSSGHPQNKKGMQFVVT